jgi:deoxyribonuclease-4
VTGPRPDGPKDARGGPAAASSPRGAHPDGRHGAGERLPGAGRSIPRQPLPGGRRAGPHLPIGHGLLRAADRAAQIGAWSIQIFSDNPTSWRRRPEPPPEAEAFRRRLEELDIAPLAIHAAYLINLAGSDQSLWSRSVEVLRRELAIAPALGARFVNVHAGSHRGSSVAEGIGRLVDGIERALTGVPAGGDAPFVVVENSSGGGDSVGVTVDELALICRAAESRGLGERLRFCLDTAHLWGAGYDISTEARIDLLLAEFDRLIGLERLAMIHLNDTVSGLGSRHDHHTHLGEGRIGTAALKYLLRNDILRHVAYYFETPGMESGFDAVNMARLYDLAAGRRLTPLDGLGQADVPSRASLPATVAEPPSTGEIEATLEGAAVVEEPSDPEAPYQE